MVVNQVLLLLLKPQPYVPAKTFATNCRFCSAECPVQVNGDECRRLGRQYGRDTASKACATTEQFCNGGQPPRARMSAAGIGRVTLDQCAQIAYGACQAIAYDPIPSPCGRSIRHGFRQCDAEGFNRFYRGEVDDYCRKLAEAIAPGTGTKSQPVGPSRPSSPATSVGPLRPSSQSAGGPLRPSSLRLP